MSYPTSFAETTISRLETEVQQLRDQLTNRARQAGQAQALASLALRELAGPYPEPQRTVELLLQLLSASRGAEAPEARLDYRRISATVAACRIVELDRLQPELLESLLQPDLYTEYAEQIRARLIREEGYAPEATTLAAGLFQWVHGHTEKLLDAAADESFGHYSGGLGESSRAVLDPLIRASLEAAVVESTSEDALTEAARPLIRTCVGWAAPGARPLETAFPVLGLDTDEICIPVPVYVSHGDLPDTLSLTVTRYHEPTGETLELPVHLQYRDLRHDATEGLVGVFGVTEVH
jgi:hypothetical protein